MHEPRKVVVELTRVWRGLVVLLCSVQGEARGEECICASGENPTPGQRKYFDVTDRSVFVHRAEAGSGGGWEIVAAF
jgi:hypothetical protein